ncbi:MAG: 4-hydroxy-tetrahydrodipicolinate synthase [Nitrospirota bacterium]|nr:4-hydroxy-tetrahydrodipicolinate synthase [Nitrospirota bacterium]
MVALVTPFQNGQGDKNGRIDERALRRLVDFHVREGTRAIVPVGTTGESATLTHEEHEQVIRIVVDQAAKRVRVLAGTGSNSTEEAVALTRAAREIGADGALVITPYYNRPTQEGLFRHYETLAMKVEFPMVIYNVPVRTGVNMLPETIARLASIPEYVGVKEASGNMGQIVDLFNRLENQMAVYSGDDLLTYSILTLGGHGTISVSANLVPRKMADLCDLALSGNFREALAVHNSLIPLHRALGFETNPIPIKTAMALAGMIGGEMRLPLVPMDESNKTRLAAVIRSMGLEKETVQ